MNLLLLLLLLLTDSLLACGMQLNRLWKFLTQLQNKLSLVVDLVHCVKDMFDLVCSILFSVWQVSLKKDSIQSMITQLSESRSQYSGAQNEVSTLEVELRNVSLELSTCRSKLECSDADVCIQFLSFIMG